MDRSAAAKPWFGRTSGVLVLVLITASFLAARLIGQHVERRQGHAVASIHVGAHGDVSVMVESGRSTDSEMIADVRAVATSAFPGRHSVSHINGNHLGPSFAVATINDVYDVGEQPSLTFHPKAMSDYLASAGLPMVEIWACPPGGVDMVVAPPRRHSIDGDCKQLNAQADLAMATLYPQPESWWRTLGITGFLLLIAIAGGVALLRRRSRLAAILAGATVAGSILTFFWIRDPAEVTVTGKSALIGESVNTWGYTVAFGAGLLLLVMATKQASSLRAARGPHPPAPPLAPPSAPPTPPV